RALTLAVLSTLPLGLLAVPAKADTQLLTGFTGFTSSVSAVDYQQPVTFEGDLLEHTGTNVTSPAAGETVQVQFEPTGQTSYETVASGTTGSDGHFAISTALPSGGRARAVYAGSAALHSSESSGWTELQANHVPSRFVLDQVPASVSTGTQVTFAGQLQVQVDGVWQPFEGYEPITVGTVEYATDTLHGGHVTQTGADGRFRV